MDTTNLIGLVAGFLTTIAFVPQVTKIWKSKSAKDVSLPTFLAFSLGVGLWIAYGVLKQEPPIIIWNVVTLALSAAIVVMKWRFD
ncbi:MAG TPA: SemiSWEET transporter [Usitatibacter sp.]|nr:SemiSWEET transporter [Usitatibacter sp.]